MTNPFIGPAPLYRFLYYCEQSALEKIILDCGAGGAEPPLAMFHDRGYTTHGVDISRRQLAKTDEFCRRRNLDLGIIKADMRALPFADRSFSFAFAYSSICHMTKSDAARAMHEISRILRKDGLCFVSFCAAGEGIPEDIEPNKPGEYPGRDKAVDTIHSLYDGTEPDRFFTGFDLLYRERRQIENLGKPRKYAWAEIDYIARKL